MSAVHPVLLDVERRIVERSREGHAAYLDKLARMRRDMPPRRTLSCGNIAHVAAACGAVAKARIAGETGRNLAIVTAYNDMLSAHQPFETYPALIRSEAERLGHSAQVAGGVPAMCDGVTQGQPGMELSLFSRDVIAMATAVSLSHNAFDGALFLGVCDKIVPGLVIGALAFGHLPAVFVPAGPMPSGLSNDEKTRIRQAYADGKLDRAALLNSEMRSYHAPGTCTFYGTANSNQMLMEIMGLHVPGAAFVPPGTALREALTREAVRAALESGKGSGERLSARSFVNAIAGLHATGGSTNHLIHLVAMAAAAGFAITWQDFADLAKVVPLIARIYPNGPADVNQFHAAGGIAFVIRELLAAGLLFDEVETVAGSSLSAYAREPFLRESTLEWRDGPAESLDRAILRPAGDPFEANGGLAVLSGNLGTAIVKASAVAPENRVLTAPARVFASQEAFHAAFKAGTLLGDLVILLLNQGPCANGMPELHGLMPPLGVMQGRGQRVALVTDGRLSGASGKILAALHVTPEAQAGGMIGRLQDGDPVTVDAVNGVLSVALEDRTLAARSPCPPPADHEGEGLGRELFAPFRQRVGPADLGASQF